MAHEHEPRATRRRRAPMRERRYQLHGYDVVVREGDEEVELSLDGVPIPVTYLDGEYQSQLAHSFRGFPTVDALVEELLRNEGRLWTLHGGVHEHPGHEHPGHEHGGHEHGGAHS